MHVMCVCQTQTDSFMFQGRSSSNMLPFSLTQPSRLLCPQLASCYLAPSGGSLWPAVSPVFSHCWFWLGSKMLPLARGMSSRLALIIPPHFNGKPVRHAGFTNASCRVLSQLFHPWKQLANKANIMFQGICDSV